jgi:CRP/FNR family transcriptional regulator, cyclic AMP receptor protein
MKRNLADRAGIVQSIPMFAGLRKKDITALARGAGEEWFEPETRVVTQGEQGDAAYIITDGKAAVVRNGRRVAELGAGAVFGEMSLLDGGERSATVVMKTRGSVLKIEKEAFDAMLDASSSAARVVLAQMAARLREADRQLYG